MGRIADDNENALNKINNGVERARAGALGGALRTAAGLRARQVGSQIGQIGAQAGTLARGIGAAGRMAGQQFGAQATGLLEGATGVPWNNQPQQPAAPQFPTSPQPGTMQSMGDQMGGMTPAPRGGGINPASAMGALAQQGVGLQVGAIQEPLNSIGGLISPKQREAEAAAEAVAVPQRENQEDVRKRILGDDYLSPGAIEAKVEEEMEKNSALRESKRIEREAIESSPVMNADGSEATDMEKLRVAAEAPDALEVLEQEDPMTGKTMFDGRNVPAHIPRMLQAAMEDGSRWLDISNAANSDPFARKLLQWRQKQIMSGQAAPSAAQPSQSMSLEESQGIMQQVQAENAERDRIKANPTDINEMTPEDRFEFENWAKGADLTAHGGAEINEGTFKSLHNQWRQSKGERREARNADRPSAEGRREQNRKRQEWQREQAKRKVGRRRGVSGSEVPMDIDPAEARNIQKHLIKGDKYNVGSETRVWDGEKFVLPNKEKASRQREHDAIQRKASESRQREIEALEKKYAEALAKQDNWDTKHEVNAVADSVQDQINARMKQRVMEYEPDEGDSIDIVEAKGAPWDPDTNRLQEDALDAALLRYGDDNDDAVKQYLRKRGWKVP